MTNKKKTNSPKRHGLLAEPLPPMRGEGLIAQGLREQGKLNGPQKEMLDLIILKLQLLAEAYGIADDSARYFRLALELAKEYEPGFQVAVKRGVKKKWDDGAIQALIVDMEKLIVKGDPSKGASWAASQLAKREPWKSFINKHSEASKVGEPLRKKYQDYKDTELASDGKKLYQEMVSKGREDLWNLLWRPTVKK